MAAATSLSPRTNSVEPPPISTTKNGASDAGSSFVAPRKESRASSSPLITSGSIPSRLLTPEVKISRFVASLVALVAQNLIFSTPRREISVAYLSMAANVLLIESG